MEVVQNDLIETEYPVCAVEYCEQTKSIYTGAYELLDGETSERKGKLVKYEINEEKKFKKINELETGAILDVKLSEKIVYFVDDRGQLCQVDNDKIVNTVQVSSGLLMSLSVLDRQIATSSSVGSVSIYDSETMKETAWLPCHDDAEAWIVTLGPNETMFTGGDDSFFRLWDLRTHEPIIEKKFSAGQTSAEFHPTEEKLLVQGGYDDTIRLWDTRNWKRPLSEKFLKGGVWRTRFTKNGKHILVPCMYENAKILKLSDNQELSVLWSSECHSSITYGGCWNEGEKMAYTSSFYDKKLACWQYTL